MALRKGQKINRPKGYHSGVRQEDVARFGAATAFLLRKPQSLERRQHMAEKTRAQWQRAKALGLRTLKDLCYTERG
mgnify:CR=1 FL=1